MKADISISIEFRGGNRFGQTIKRIVRTRAGLWVKNHIQERVSKSGMGADGALVGYSTAPLIMEPHTSPPRLKRIIKPKGQKGKRTYRSGRSKSGDKVRFRFYPRGYKQYKRETGQNYTKFTMTNKGHFWRDWKVLQGRNKSSGDVLIGWSRPENAKAADVAIEKQPSRQSMFALNRGELELLSDEIGSALAEQIAKVIKGSKRKI